MSVLVVNVIELLDSIRSVGGGRSTHGLPDETLERFALSDPTLAEAIAAAVEEFKTLRAEFPDFVDLDEVAQVAAIQSRLVNF